MGLFTRDKKVDDSEKQPEEPSLLCPRCKVFMKKITKKGITIDVCAKCHGMWLDDREIEHLLGIDTTQKTKKVKKKWK
jgi:Zn-finger nucleic acid-binding protein